MKYSRLVTISCFALAVSISEPASAGFFKKIGKAFEKGAKSTVKVIVAPVKVAVDVVEGKSFSDSLEETADDIGDVFEATLDVAGTTLDAVILGTTGAAGKTGPKIPGRKGTDGILELDTQMVGGTYVAIGIVLIMILFPDEVCELLHHEDNCSINSEIALGTDGSVQIGNEPPVKITPSHISTLSALDDYGWMKDIPLEDWQEEIENGEKLNPGLKKEKEDQRLIIGSSLLNTLGYKNNKVTWFEELPTPPTLSGKLRKNVQGYARVGARRGNRLHKGTDYHTYPSDVVIAPFDGEVSVGSYYQWKTVRVTNSRGMTFVAVYMQDSVELHKAKQKRFVKRGEVIALADSLQKPGPKRYSKKVPNHIHVNYISPEGVYISPDNNIGVVKKSDWAAKELCTTSICFHSFPKPRDKLK